MDKQMKEFEMNIKDLEININEFPRTHSVNFEVKVPGRIVEWNNVVGSIQFICDSTSGWRLKWDVAILRNEKLIIRKMKSTPLKAKIQKILEVAVIREIQKWETGLELDEENLMRERISECIDWENKIQQKMKSAHAESNRVIQKVVDADKDHLRVAHVVARTDMPEMPEFLKR